MKRVRLYYLIDVACDDIKEYGIKVSGYINELIPLLQAIEDKFYAKVGVKIIVYEEWAKWFSDKDESLSSWIYKHVNPTGKSEFGNALNLLGTDLADSDEYVCPIIIHLPHTVSTDDYNAVISKLNNLPAYKNALKLSVNMTEYDYNREDAYNFTGSSSHILSADNKELLSYFIMCAIEDYYREHNENYYDVKIDDLNLSHRATSQFKRCGCVTVGDFFSRNKKSEDMMGVGSTVGISAFDELTDKLVELGFLSAKEYGLRKKNFKIDAYLEKNHPGRDKCDKLRDIRKKIAEANDIPFESAECHHTGPCSGTCPVCDSEVKYLDEELQRKKARGEQVILSGLAIDVKDDDYSEEDDDDSDDRGIDSIEDDNKYIADGDFTSFGGETEPREGVHGADNPIDDTKYAVGGMMLPVDGYIDELPFT